MSGMFGRDNNIYEFGKERTGNAEELIGKIIDIAEQSHRALERVTTGNFTHNVRMVQCDLAILAGYASTIRGDIAKD